MARKKRKAKLTEEGRQRGPMVLELHDEVLPAGFDGDGVLDGVQEFATRSRAWASVSKASYNGVKSWLELDDLAGVLWAWIRQPGERDLGNGNLTQVFRTSR
jgi:hypothetical protein